MTEQTAPEPVGSNTSENEQEQTQTVQAQASATENVESQTHDKQTAQGRINQLYGKSKHLERENAAQAARIAELEAATKPKEQAPTLEAFDYDDDKYQSALIEHKAKEIVGQTLAEREKSAQVAAQQAKQAELVSNFNKASEVYGADNPEFIRLQNEAYQAGIINAIPEGVQNAIAANPNGPKMLHALLQDTAKIDALVNADPYTAGMHLANLESAVAVKTISEAPTPVATLGDGGASNGQPTSDQLSNMSANEYYAWRMKNK